MGKKKTKSKQPNAKQPKAEQVVAKPAKEKKNMRCMLLKVELSWAAEKQEKEINEWLKGIGDIEVVSVTTAPSTQGLIVCVWGRGG